MLNKNYRKCVGKAFWSQAATFTDFNGNTFDVNPVNVWRFIRTSGTAYYMRLYVGTGNSTSTDDTYSMDNNIELSCITSSKVDGIDNCITSLTETFVNNTGNEVTIKEIGIGFSYNWEAGNCLLGRIVLSNPVTIANGETYAFNYTIK